MPRPSAPRQLQQLQECLLRCLGVLSSKRADGVVIRVRVTCQIAHREISVRRSLDASGGHLAVRVAVDHQRQHHPRRLLPTSDNWRFRGNALGPAVISPLGKVRQAPRLPGGSDHQSFYCNSFIMNYYNGIRGGSEAPIARTLDHVIVSIQKNYQGPFSCRYGLRFAFTVAAIHGQEVSKCRTI